MKKIFLFLFGSACAGSWLTAFSQNIGIGTTTPTRAKLEVHGSVGATSAIFGGESTGISLQRDWPSVGFNQYYNAGSKYIGNGFAAVQFIDPNLGYMAFDMFPSGLTNAAAGTPVRAMHIHSNGNVGIRGAGFANASLAVARGNGSDGTAVFQGTTHHSIFNSSTTENTYIRAGKSNGDVYINDVPGGDIFMGSGNSYVGINTSFPAYPLEIRQINDKGLLLVSPVDNFDNWELVTYSYGNPDAFLIFKFNATIKATINPADGSYYSASDRRLKTNIESLPSVLGKVLRLQAVEYEMKQHNPNHKKTFGFIAQDVKKIFPHLVTVLSVGNSKKGYEDIPDLHGMNYSGFGVIAIKAIQEQQQQIELLRNEINELKSLITRMNPKN
jgi:hypothetical protein